MTETDHLLSSPKNRERLLKSIADMNRITLHESIFGKPSHELLGVILRKHFDHVLKEEVPEHLKRLLDALK